MAKNFDCIFCSIIEEKIKANIVSNTEHVIAFFDINPVADVHILIIPKLHIASVDDFVEAHADIMKEMMLEAKKLAREFNIAQSGYRLVMNTGANAGQTVFHMHLHLLGGRNFSWPPG